MMAFAPKESFEGKQVQGSIALHGEWLLEVCNLPCKIAHALAFAKNIMHGILKASLLALWPFTCLSHCSVLFPCPFSTRSAPK